MNNHEPILLDCTLRDGGYHNGWDFSADLIQEYLDAIASAGVDWVEIGFRMIASHDFFGGCAYSTDEFIGEFSVPDGLRIAVMINASDILSPEKELDSSILERLFRPAEESAVEMVRVACHAREFQTVLPAAKWLSAQGYLVGFNIMQIADRSPEEIQELSKSASAFPIEVLYFADSLGNLTTERVAEIVRNIQSGWTGQIGIHTHDNMARALVNAAEAYRCGVGWIDGTITGMGRGPGNAKTEILVLEFEEFRPSRNADITSVLGLMKKHFLPLQSKFGWGMNPYYYLAGRYGVHPTFVQEMMNDSRYSDEDILISLEHLNTRSAKSFRRSVMESSRNFYTETVLGGWKPAEVFTGKDVLILGSGPGIKQHRRALEQYIRRCSPMVIALNTGQAIDSECVDFHIASHPLRLAADCELYPSMPHPLIAPISALPDHIRARLKGVDVKDFGIGIEDEKFEFHGTHAIIPSAPRICLCSRCCDLW
jgi:4-hydroxy 2-oxovalerate aldolase